MISWLRRVLGRAPSKTRLASAPALPSESAPAKAAQVMEDIRRQVELDVAGGFVTRDEILQTAIDVFEGEADPALVRAESQRALDAALAARAMDQASWPETTDCDRLDAAFAALEAEGVISRQNFSCCGTCGSTEIWDEIDTARAAGRPANGYAFYHQQDTESAIEGYGLHLNYGAYEEGPEAAVAIGHQIVNRLEEHGLHTDWDGRIERRIGVSLDWKRRSTLAGV